jgi:putative endonuclease
MNTYYVYILTTVSRNVMYVGVTNDLERRIDEHRDGRGGAFTKRYRVNTLVYAETYEQVDEAITREKKSRLGGDPRRTRWSRKPIRLGPIYSMG